MYEPVWSPLRRLIAMTSKDKTGNTFVPTVTASSTTLMEL